MAQSRRSRPAQPERLSFGAWMARLGGGAMGWTGWLVVAAITLLVIALVGYLVGHG